MISASIGIDWLTDLVGPATKVNWGIVISIVFVFSNSIYII